MKHPGNGQTRLSVSSLLRIGILVGIFLAVAVVALSQTAVGQNHRTATPRYEVADLGPIQRLASDLAPGLNSRGDVVVWRQNESQAFSPVLWSGREQKTLGIPAGYRNSFAYSVNDSGNAAGWANTTLNPVDSFSVVHAVMLSDHGVTDLGALGGNWSRAYAINNDNVIVGIAELANKQQRAFRYVDGKMSELTPLPEGKSSIAFGINDDGLVAGGSDVPHSSSLKMLMHAVLWRNGTATDLGTLSTNGNSLAYAVNNRGEVAGKADMKTGETAFLYRDGHMIDLGIESGHAFGINDKTQIVGSQQIGEERHPHSRGFLWDNGVFYDLNRCLPEGSPYSIQGAFRINNAGQIAAIGALGNQLRALLLTPIQ